MIERVLILGGYGVFGSRLAIQLLRRGRYEVVVAGRDQKKLHAFCTQVGALPYRLDRDSNGELDSALRELSPTLIVDAAGPFQAYGTDRIRLARKAIETGIHYLDLADDRSFVLGFSELDRLAKTQGVSALSGASSIPSLSAAAADVLCKNLKACQLIETAIVPGNRAPRGASLIRAILSQVGRPIRMWRGGRFSEALCWGETKTIRLSIPGVPPLTPRWVSLFNAPDYDLFPRRYGATSVLFYAGLELKLLHGGLWGLGWLVRLRILTSLAPCARLATWVAERFTRFGSDRGGMTVSVFGRNCSGAAVRRTWTLIAEAGDGPNIPIIPAVVMVEKILAREVAPGARPCVGEFTLSEAETAMQSLATKTHIDEQPAQPLFERALGEGFCCLPAAVQNLHTVFDRRIYEGRATIQRGRSFVSKLYAFIAGFPPASAGVPVEVQIARTRAGEHWIRQFGARRFESHLHRWPNDEMNIVWERFGVLSFAIRLEARAEGLRYPIQRARLGRLPLPRFLLPLSESSESQDETGAFRFDVSLSLPTGGLIARYTGSLRPVESPVGDISRSNANGR